MQKISSYLYPNRIQLLVNLANFSTEFTNVYQRTVKIYQGVDNVIEFDIKNADQKRIDLTTEPLSISDIKLHLMDAAGNSISAEPYSVTPSGTLKGIATVTIPAIDLAGLTKQFLRYSITATQDNNTIPLYADTRFSASGTIELDTTISPIIPVDRVYKTFTAEIDLNGVPTWHSSAIPSTFYEATKTEALTFSVKLSGFTGSVWVEATTDSTISAESFKKSTYLASYSFDNFSGFWDPTEFSIGDYKYFRVSYSTPLSNGIGASFKVDIIDGVYSVNVRAGGTGYAIGSQIKILGSVLGGTDGINDLVISIDAVDSSSTGYISSYSVSSIKSISWSGTAISGNATYIATGTNITGTVDKVTVN